MYRCLALTLLKDSHPFAYKAHSWTRRLFHLTSVFPFPYFRFRTSVSISAFSTCPSQRIAPLFLPPQHSDPATRDFQFSISVEALLPRVSSGHAGPPTVPYQLSKHISLIPRLSPLRREKAWYILSSESSLLSGIMVLVNYLHFAVSDI